MQDKIKHHICDTDILETFQNPYLMQTTVNFIETTHTIARSTEPSWSAPNFDTIICIDKVCDVTPKCYASPGRFRWLIYYVCGQKTSD